MREENPRYNQEPTVSEDAPARQSLTSSDAQQWNGFTAVNGDNHGNHSFRPDDSARQYMPRHESDAGDPRRPPPINLNFHSHGWRPDERSTQEEAPGPQRRELSPSRKRKRSSISVNVDNPDANHGLTADKDGHESSKRRTTSTLDSAIDLTSPLTTMLSATTPVDRRQNEPPPAGPYAR